MPIYKRNGHWHFTKTIHGVRYRCALPTARTKGQAEEAERQKLKEIHEGTFGKSKASEVFIDFAERVYLPWSKENKRSTNDQYHIKTFRAFFRRKTFAEITPMLIEKFKSVRRKTPIVTGKGDGMKSRPRRPASVNRELECLSSIFAMAMRKPHCLIRENPCREVAKLKEENRRSRYLSADEEKRLLAVCVGEREHLLPNVVLALNTGMRRGEILNLRWSQVDFGRSQIHLTRTKSGKERDVPMNTQVHNLLFNLARHESGFVFASQKTSRALTHCKRAFTKACELANITDLHFHDLRHTAATRLAEMGAEPFTIKDILGHSDLRMTDRYTHAVEWRKREALERIGNYGEQQKAGVVSLAERKRA
jgi:integrase